MPTRGKVLRSRHHWHVGDSVSLMFKKFTVSKSGIKQGSSVDLFLDVKVDGWVPLMVADVTSSHAGSFTITQHRITSDGKAFVTFYGELNWAELTINCTVLYAKEPFIIRRDYI